MTPNERRCRIHPEDNTALGEDLCQQDLDIQDHAATHPWHLEGSPMPPIDIGARVCFSAAFLRSIGVYTGDMPFAVGTVVDLVPLGERQLAEVAWDAPGELPGRVLTGNLWPVGHLEPA